MNESAVTKWRTNDLGSVAEMRKPIKQAKNFCKRLTSI